MPATKPPSRRSSPRSLARPASPKISTITRRTGSWLLVSSAFSATGQPRAANRTDAAATATASTANPASTSASVSGRPVERTTVTRTIGPNSPTAPAASR